jgi:hypothetical protein
MLFTKTNTVYCEKYVKNTQVHSVGRMQRFSVAYKEDFIILTEAIGTISFFVLYIYKIAA